MDKPLRWWKLSVYSKIGDSECASLRVSVHVFTPPSSEQKWQASVALSYSDMTHAMSTASDGCGSFNCMSALNDGILNSYTFHTIAFRPGRGPGRQPGISVAIWRGRQSPCWVIGGLTPSPMHQTNCYTVLKPHIGCQATGLVKHAHTYHHI